MDPFNSENNTMNAFVYCWTDHKTNMLYVGWHKGTIDDGYICSSKLVKEQYQIRPEDFSRQIIATGSARDCSNLEKLILTTVDAKHNYAFYNLTNGNNGGFFNKFHTEATKQKIGQANKAKKHVGRPHSEEAKRKMSVVKMGHVVTQETREKISLACKGKEFSEEHKHNISLSLKGKPGRKHSEATKKKISEANVGRVHSSETKEKFKNRTPWNKGKKTIVSEETRQRCSLSAKRAWAKRRKTS